MAKYKDCDAAWELLQVSDEAKAVLEGWGATEAADLHVLDEPKVVQLAGLLKHVPSVKFRHAMGDTEHEAHWRPEAADAQWRTVIFELIPGKRAPPQTTEGLARAIGAGAAACAYDGCTIDEVGSLVDPNGIVLAAMRELTKYSGHKVADHDDGAGCKHRCGDILDDVRMEEEREGFSLGLGLGWWWCGGGGHPLVPREFTNSANIFNQPHRHCDNAAHSCRRTRTS